MCILFGGVGSIARIRTQFAAGSIQPFTFPTLFKADLGMYGLQEIVQK